MTIDSQSNGTEFVPNQFVDRRDPSLKRSTPGLERRQFSDGHDQLSAEAAELGRAIDQYKLQKCRKYISYEEMLSVIKTLGYARPDFG